MERLIWISIGGAFGTGGRYLVDLCLTRLTEPGIPVGTLTVNLFGSFFLGLLMCAASDADGLSTTTLLALTTGALGGFTTYSTFSYETMEYLADGKYGIAAVYVGTTLVLCLAGSFSGAALGNYHISP